MKMFYEFNLITRKRAFIFISTKCNGLERTEAETNGERAVDLFQDILEFDDVQVFYNLPKGQIIEQLKFIRMLSDQFEQEKKDNKDKKLEEDL